MATSGQGVAVPYAVERDASEVTALTSASWLVQQGSAVAGFFGANGPPEIVEYNFNKVRGAKLDAVRVEHLPIVQHAGSARATHEYEDKLRLTSLGHQELGRAPHKLVYSLQLACTGNSLRQGVSKADEDVANCQRACGGVGQCTAACTVPPGKVKRTFHICTVRVHVTRSLQHVKDGKVLITIHGRHVPEGTTRVPPQPARLRPDAGVKRALVQSVAAGDTSATVAVGKLEVGMGSASTSGEFSGRYFPSAGQVQRAKEYLNACHRGEAKLGDWERTNQLVTRQLIQRGNVLCFKPFPADEAIVVLSTEAWLARYSKYGRRLASTDSKHDTTRNCRSLWSSLRFPTPWGWYAACVWISQKDTQVNIQLSLLVISVNAPCDDPQW